MDNLTDEDVDTLGDMESLLIKAEVIVADEAVMYIRNPDGSWCGARDPVMWKAMRALYDV